MESKEFYDSTAELYGKRHDNETTKYIRKKELKLIKKYAFGKILDVGCGDGFHFCEIGIDNSIKMLKLSKNTSVLADANNIPIKSESFDTVICMLSSFNFFPSAVDELKRVLKKDGRIILSVTSINDDKELKLLKKIHSSENSRSFFSEKYVQKKIRIEGHRVNFNLFTKEHLIDLFKMKLEYFDGIFILQKPYWGWFRSFTIIEKLRLFLERFTTKERAKVYFIVFRKDTNIKRLEL